ncbi:acetate/propionate family kinase [Roseovarius arcticus]|uniref:acetate/propionate family kinase n=1 Tax=Roseovarius arcticus TaxID=2547404 RepID=UPI00110FFECA|nr:acetate kinase [Roseovarius arcticus]
MISRAILVLNAGSSTIKAAVFVNGREVARAGSDAVPDHGAALSRVMADLAAQGHAIDSFAAAAHRVVHGGEALGTSARITPEVRAQIADCIPLAPLHNPHHLEVIDSIAALAPDLPQFASFDTAFHASIPEVATRYALPCTPDTRGLRRYGFHGISYAALVEALPRQTGQPLPGRLLAFHLGNGASICAIREGRSVGTTMGYSPNAGLTMGTRSGDMDPAAVLELARRLGVDAAEHLLTHASGLLGLSGDSFDMRALQASGAPGAQLAIWHFCYWSARHAGSMIAAMGGLDAIAFTGGIGENAGDIRNDILLKLKWAGDVPTHIVPAQEEAFVAREASNLMEGPEFAA